MNKQKLLGALLTMILAGSALAQKAPTARQLFMLLPEAYIGGTADDREAALVFPASDTRDYLSFMVADATVPKSLAVGLAEPEGLGAMRVFRAKSSVLVGLRLQVGDGAEKNPTIDSVKVVTVLLEYRNGKWSDVTATRLPKMGLDVAYRALTGSPEARNVNPEDVWIETQVSRDEAGIQLVARAKGYDGASTLGSYLWNGREFVASK